ncbi:MAG: copper-binding protein [Blastocatellales bacterium]
MRRIVSVFSARWMWRTLICCLLMLAAINAAGCQTALSKGTPHIKRYDLSGRVEFIDQKNSGITVAHEDIPGFMPAMTMLFKVKDKAALRRLAVGDQIKAVVSYNQQTRETWLQDIVVTNKKRGEK